MDDNLWGDIPAVPSLSTPYSVLVAQGDVLNKATGGGLSGYVQKNTQGSNFILDFYIHAKSLNNYKYHLLRLIHDVKLYPVKIFVNDMILNEASDEYLFKYYLKDILSSDETKKILSALLAQVRDEGEEIPF